MDQLRMTSPDLTQANIDKLAELFPTVVTETRGADGEVKRAIDFDCLRQELSDHVIDGPQERYQLDWPGKRAAALAANTPIAKTLRPMREESVNFDTTKNIFIEGDNLDALKLLQESYLGQVDVVYIDPPYNTGNDSFIYLDRFQTSADEYYIRSGQSGEDGTLFTSNPRSSGRFHSSWLEMIYPRLRLARNLLAETGVIGVSIGEDEVAQLRIMCNEVFGEDNFIALVAVEMSTTQGMKVRAAQNGKIVKNSEYLLIYGRSAAAIGRNRTPLFDHVSGWPGNFGTWLHGDNTFEPLIPYLSRQELVSREFSLKFPGEKLSMNHLSALYACSRPFREFVFNNLDHIAASDKGSWPLDQDEPDWQDGRAFEYQVDGKKYVVTRSSKGTIRQFLRLSENFRTADDYAGTYGRTVIRGDLWKGFYSDMAHVSLEGGTNFSNGKKPMRLVTNFITWACGQEDALVMDFFAGSGTTGHAVMRMNSKDGGRRRFILVQAPELVRDQDSGDESTTVSDITRKRLVKALDECKRAAAEHGDFGYRSLRIDSPTFFPVQYRPEEIGQMQLDGLISSIKPDRTTEDLLFQVLLDWGLELSLPVIRRLIDGAEVFEVDEGALIACFAEALSSKLIRVIAGHKPIRAVFRDSGFADDAARINAEQIFREVSPQTSVKVI